MDQGVLVPVCRAEERVRPQTQGQLGLRSEQALSLVTPALEGQTDQPAKGRVVLAACSMGGCDFRLQLHGQLTSLPQSHPKTHKADTGNLGGQ